MNTRQAQQTVENVPAIGYENWEYVRLPRGVYDWQYSQMLKDDTLKLIPNYKRTVITDEWLENHPDFLKKQELAAQALPIVEKLSNQLDNQQQDIQEEERGKHVPSKSQVQPKSILKNSSERKPRETSPFSVIQQDSILGKRMKREDPSAYIMPTTCGQSDEEVSISSFYPPWWKPVKKDEDGEYSTEWKVQNLKQFAGCHFTQVKPFLEHTIGSIVNSKLFGGAIQTYINGNKKARSSSKIDLELRVKNTTWFDDFSKKTVDDFKQSKEKESSNDELLLHKIEKFERKIQKTFTAITKDQNITQHAYFQDLEKGAIEKINDHFADLAEVKEIQYNTFVSKVKGTANTLMNQQSQIRRDHNKILRDNSAMKNECQRTSNEVQQLKGEIKSIEGHYEDLNQLCLDKYNEFIQDADNTYNKFADDQFLTLQHACLDMAQFNNQSMDDMAHNVQGVIDSIANDQNQQDLKIKDMESKMFKMQRVIENLERKLEKLTQSKGSSLQARKDRLKKEIQKMLPLRK